MELDKYVEEEVAKEFRVRREDTQSADIQIAILTERIRILMEEARALPWDRAIRSFLLDLVAKRRKLLSYLQNTDTARYQKVIGKLGLAQ